MRNRRTAIALACTTALLTCLPLRAQQRVILNQNFVQLKSGANGAPSATYSGISAYDPQFCSTGPSPGVPANGNCLKYFNDARCLAPTTAPPPTGTNALCVVGWETTDEEVSIVTYPTVAPILSNGAIRHPVQLNRTIGTQTLEGLQVPDGSAELNAQTPGRIYQNICLAPGEAIPFTFQLGDPRSTDGAHGPGTPSQARFGVWSQGSGYPAAALSSVTSPANDAQSFITVNGNLSAPATGGIYQLGFEAVQPTTDAFGNYLRNVSITLTPLIDLGGGTTPTTDAHVVEPAAGTVGFPALTLRLNGAVPAGGIQIPVTLLAGATATPDADFMLGTPTGGIGGLSLTHTAGSSTWTLNVPAGDYHSTLSGQPAITIPVDVLADAVLVEPVEQFAFRIGSVVGGVIADPLCDNTFLSQSANFVIDQPGQIALRKTTVGIAGGPFGFTLTNTAQTSGTVSTTAAATPAQVDGDNATAGTQPFLVAAASQPVTLDESSLPASWSLQDATCTNAANATVGSLSGTTYTLPGSETGPNTSITCTFTNARLPADLAITKTNTPGVNGEVDQANDTLVSGTTTVYTIRVSNQGPGDADGARVRDTPGTGLSCPATNPVTISGDGVPAGGPFTVGDLSGAGIALGNLAPGETAVLSFGCDVL